VSEPVNQLRPVQLRAVTEAFARTRDLLNDVKCRVLTISSIESQESKVAQSRRPAPPDLGEELR
jgi:hypothetical protein